jgi:hypothetical protein
MMAAMLSRTGCTGDRELSTPRLHVLVPLRTVLVTNCPRAHQVINNIARLEMELSKTLYDNLK